MPTPQVFKATFFEDSGGSLMARVLGTGSTNIAQADLSAVAYKVFNKTIPNSTAIASATLTTSAVVFDTLQTDARWSIDTTGYNFRYDVGSSEVPDGDQTYRFEFTFTPASGSQFKLAWDVKTIDLIGS